MNIEKPNAGETFHCMLWHVIFDRVIVLMVDWQIVYLIEDGGDFLWSLLSLSGLWRLPLFLFFSSLVLLAATKRLFE